MKKKKRLKIGLKADSNTSLKHLIDINTNVSLQRIRRNHFQK